ncbi:MAG: tetratricopeptide repeat protein [Candidatus Omnitrophica bacterium]|nr:tetratricopeptide repeat protein [Candidatus Omnitrophota bacterium]
MNNTKLFVSVLLLLSLCGISHAQIQEKIGVAPFKDVSVPRSLNVQPESLQAFLVRTLNANYGISTVMLEPTTKTIGLKTDPNTQLLPPTYRSGGWKGNTIRRVETDWREVARKKRLTLLIYGIYEEAGEHLRYAAEAMEPISGRILFSCKAEGAIQERFTIENRLAEKIALKMEEVNVVDEVTKARREVYEKRLVTEGLTDTKEFLSIAQKDPTAEDHYENGYALTRQYETSKDIKYLEGAAEEYRAALALDPKHFRALNNMGTVMHRLEKFEDAIGYYQRVLEINPTYARAMENSALAYQSLHQYDSALAMWKNALEYEDRADIRKTIEETIVKLEESVGQAGE